LTQKSSLNAGGVTIAIILGLIAGPIIFYAIAGDYWHTLNVHVNQLVAGGVGAVVGIVALVNATRFRNAGLAGAVTGVAAGAGEFVVAFIPWVGFNTTHPTCDPNQICPLSATTLQQIALVSGLFSVVLFTIAGFSLASLITFARSRVS
jgi:hypothetical protein